MATMSDRKSWYHSDLCKAGPLTLRFTGPVRESKDKGKFYRPFALENGDEKYLTIEGDAAGYHEAVEAVPQGQWVTVIAMGARDGATFTVDGQAFDGDPGEDWEPAPAKPVAKAAPRPAAAHQAPPPPKTVPLVPLMRQCIDAAVELLDGQELTEAERAIALSLFIEIRRNGGATL